MILMFYRYISLIRRQYCISRIHCFAHYIHILCFLTNYSFIEYVSLAYFLMILNCHLQVKHQTKMGLDQVHIGNQLTNDASKKQMWIKQGVTDHFYKYSTLDHTHKNLPREGVQFGRLLAFDTPQVCGTFLTAHDCLSCFSTKLFSWLMSHEKKSILWPL
jgi:hypothetical protein